MSKNEEITIDLALRILDEGIERCMQSLEALNDDYDNIFGEMRMYQLQKESMLRGGDGFD